MKRLLFKIGITGTFLALLVALGGHALAQSAQSVSVNWDDQVRKLDNTNPADPFSGEYFVQFASNGQVSRTATETVYLMMEPKDGGAATRLCSYEGAFGNSFGVSYPSCATGSQLIPQHINGSSVFQAKKTYLVYFADSLGNKLNSNLYELPEIPENLDPNDYAYSVKTQVVSLPDGAGTYYEFEVGVDQPVATEFSFSVSKEGSTSETLIGSTSITSGTVTIPTTAPSAGFAPGSYVLKVRRGGEEISTDPLPVIDGTSSSVTSTTSSGGLFSSTQLSLLEGGLVPDCGYDIKSSSNSDGAGRVCGLSDLVQLIKNIIEYIFILILPIAAIVFVYVGFIYLTSGGNTGKHDKAKKAMGSLITGIVVILAAWLIVKSILTTLNVDTGIANMFLDLST